MRFITAVLLVFGLLPYSWAASSVSALIKASQHSDQQTRTAAQVKLAKLYQTGGEGVERDPEQAFELLTAAAGAQGKNPLAQLELGRAYFYGIGTDRNPITAYIWTTLSVQSDFPEQPYAQQMLEQLDAVITQEQRKKALEIVSRFRTVLTEQ